MGGGSHGGVFLSQELCTERATPTQLSLPFPPDEFVEHVLARGAASWVERFRRLVATVRVVQPVDVETAGLSDDEAWEHNADAMLSEALIRGISHVTLIALSAGGGGPDYLMRKARDAGVRTIVIDPWKRD